MKSAFLPPCKYRCVVAPGPQRLSHGASGRLGLGSDAFVTQRSYETVVRVVSANHSGGAPAEARVALAHSRNRSRNCVFVFVLDYHVPFNVIAHPHR